MKSKILLAMVSMSLTCCTMAQNPSGPTDQFIRENPNLGEAKELKLDTKVADKYPFIHLNANTIEYNGADWSGIREKVADAKNRKVSIVLIGDSHIQAEGSTTPTRLLLQNRYGSAGRGLIIPFKLAGTNQPFDYVIDSKDNYLVAKLLKRPWLTYMGFTGISLEPASDTFSFDIEAKPKENIPPSFNTVRILYHGNAPEVVDLRETGDDMSMYFESTTTPREVVVKLPESIEKLSIDLKKSGMCNILGFVLENGQNGILYSAIGNNGATYGTYNNVGHEGEELTVLNPDMVIISLGANESFGIITNEAFYATVDKLVKDIQKHNPDATILLTTPNETHKKNQRGVHEVNVDAKRMRDQILKYGRDHNIATYDFFEIAGGEGSSNDWIRTGIMRNDRIHHSWDGYTLQGELLYDALINAFENKTTSNNE